MMDADDPQRRCDHGSHYYGQQDENGIDLSLIRENLKLTPLERIHRANIAEQEAVRLLEYGRQHRENAIRAARTTFD